VRALLRTVWNMSDRTLFRPENRMVSRAMSTYGIYEQLLQHSSGSYGDNERESAY
jgi:hypothetical protein